MVQALSVYVGQKSHLEINSISTLQTRVGLKMSEVCGIICDMKREGEGVLLISRESSVHVLPSYIFVGQGMGQ